MEDNDLYEEGLVGTIKPSVGPLRQRFLMPPFSVFNTREGNWQDRKRRWLSLGIQSELGRDVSTYSVAHMANYEGNNANFAKLDGASIFDPVVCEIAYRWWCKPGGTILDPFAGGSVRGIVAAALDYKYRGIELRAEQVEANKQQAKQICGGWDTQPKWRQGDSNEVVPTIPDQTVDLLFSCPPYGDLEVYSDHPADISNRDYRNFLWGYGNIIEASLDKLRNNRFAVWVVANYRRPDKSMHNLVGDTIGLFERFGAKFYNDIVLVNAVGTAAMRANTTFVRGNRKVVKGHQNILVFIKGDAAIAAEDIPAKDK